MMLKTPQSGGYFKKWMLPIFRVLKHVAIAKMLPAHGLLFEPTST